MAFSYITKDNIGERLNEAKQYMRPFFEPLAEYERIARNKPKENIPDKLPKVTDGTTAAFVSSRPKAVVQQLPTGTIESLDKDEDAAGIAELILTEKIIPNATSGGSVLQKCWGALAGALTYGAQPAFMFFKNKGGYYGADFKLPYIRDVFLQPGKTTAKDCDYIFMRSWYQKADIDAIIESNVKGSGWKIDALRDLQENGKDSDSLTPAEKEGAADTQAIEIVFAFQSGVGATFYGYSPDTEAIVYEKENPDPRGIIPIHYLYVDIDQGNPIGRGAVSAVAPLQNMVDAEMQAYQYAQGLALAPPLQVTDGINLSSIRWEPNAVWHMGSNPNARVTPVNISNNIIANFPNNYSLTKSQILNINNTNDVSVSSEAGNPSFSKTSAGVKAQGERVNINDNHLMKQFEEWYGEICETMINLHVALSHGTDEIELTEEYIKRRRLDNPEFAETVAEVDYDKLTKGFAFRVDFSTSKVKQDSDAVDNLKGLLELRKQYPELQQYVNLTKVFNRLITKLGVEDPEELLNEPQGDKPTDDMEQQPTQEQLMQLMAEQQQPAPLYEEYEGDE